MDTSLVMQKSQRDIDFIVLHVLQKIVESHNERFLENDVTRGSNGARNLVFEEHDNIEPTLKTSSKLIVFLDSHQDLTIHEAPIVDEPQHGDIIIDQVLQHPQQ